MDVDARDAAQRAVFKTVKAARAAFLVDGAAYYAALVAAIERAERSILLVGWDIDSRTVISRPGAPRETISGLLNRVVAAKKDLVVHLLAWDFAMVFALERELFPVYHLGWKTHRRIHFHLDNDHPLGAAHHQKVIVIDDAIAFSGGLDVTTRRWDTQRHAPHDPRRKDPGEVGYKPFHDVQMAVDDDAARALGDLVRERWRRATGHELRPPPPPTVDPWPPDLSPDVRNVLVDIARTEPAFPARGREEIREVERLFLASIAAAKRFIYIENQYTTSTVIRDALAARLAEPGGPEVVLVIPQMCSGWLEIQTMGALRAGFLSALRTADIEGRLRVYYPRVSEDVDVFVHSKVLIIDASIVRVGSANLSNRSMRVDTECDLSIDARGDLRIKAAILRFLAGLLAEHLGASRDAVFDALDRERSLIAAVESLRGGPRTFVPIDERLEATAPIDAILHLAADPERPIDPEQLVNTFLLEDERSARARLFRRSVVAAIFVVAVAALWLFTPLRAHITPAAIEAIIGGLRSSPFAPLLVALVFAAGTLVMIPVNALILGTGLAFGPLLGTLYSMIGVLSAASAGYAVGRALGRDVLSGFLTSRINRLSRRLARAGILSVAAARLIPVAPFGVVNLVAGASHIRYRQLLLGTLLGNLPGVLLFNAFGQSLLYALLGAPRPRLFAFLFLALAAAALGAAIAFWIRRGRERPEPPPSSGPPRPSLGEEGALVK